MSTKSEREKVEEFTLRRNLEKLRVFYSVLQMAMSLLMGGVLLTTLSEILWRVIPAGKVSESIISGFAGLAWLLTSLTIVVVSVCPTEELDIDIFIASRPGLSIRFAMLPLVTGGLRALEIPFPRWISVAAGLTLVVQGCSCCCSGCRCGKAMRRWLQSLSFCALMELWYFDVIVSSTVNEIALDESGAWTSIWLAIHAALIVLVSLWLRCRRMTQKTERFYVSSYLCLSWNGSYFACRAVDLALDYKEWEEGRQEDIAIVSALGFSFLIVLPMVFAVLFGKRHLFQKISFWLDHSRGRRLQDGAFMAMLLDSYVVEVGQPWWLSDTELAELQQQNGPSNLPKEAPSLSAPSSSSVSADFDKPRPGFAKGLVVRVFEDGTSFQVKCRLDKHGESEHLVKVTRGQEVLPWPELLKMGRKKLRCVEWAALSPEVMAQNGTAGFSLSRPTGRGELIDYFVSHSWSDKAPRKWRAMQLVVDEFYKKNGRYPTFWIDKFCIDQNELADGLRVLPVNVMSCRKMLCLSGKTYHKRLWCAWELCVLLSFMSMEMALKQMVVLALSESALQQLTVFDCSTARCYNPNEEFRLRRVIEAIGKQRFEIKIRALGQLLLDREMSRDGLLMGGTTMSLAWSSEGSFQRSVSNIDGTQQGDQNEDQLVEVVF